MATKEITEKVHALLEAEHFDETVQQALLALGPEAVKLLDFYATGSHPSGNPDIQGRAILTLGETHDLECLPALKKALRSSDSDIRVRAMLAIAHLGGTEATATIRDAVYSEDCSDVERVHGIRSLGRMQTQEAKDTLESLRARSLPDSVKGELSNAISKMK